MFGTSVRTSFAFLMTVFTVILLIPSAAQADPAPATYTPAATTVAVLPVINMTSSKHPDKDAASQAKQADEGNHALAEAFGKHAFRLTDPALIASAMQTKPLNVTNQASWTADNLAAIGDMVHADIVVLMVITDTHQGFRHGFLIMGAQREGEAKTKLWLIDTLTHSAVIDGVASAGKAQASALAGWITGGIGEGSSSYVIKAIDDAANKSLTGFFKPYPADDNLSIKYVSPKPSTPSSALPVAAPAPASIAASSPAAPTIISAAPPQSLFTFANGAQTPGTLIGFDGSTYTVSTPKGMRQFRKAAIVFIHALAPATVTAAK